jgi:hypothetical protein
LLKVALWTVGWGFVCVAFVFAGAATDGDWQRLKAWLRSLGKPPHVGRAEMTVELKDIRKVAVIGWDTEHVKGSHASIQVADEEKRNVDNDGETNLFFPLDYVGEVAVQIDGSKSGKDKGTISVT